MTGKVKGKWNGKGNWNVKGKGKGRGQVKNPESAISKAFACKHLLNKAESRICYLISRSKHGQKNGQGSGFSVKGLGFSAGFRV